MVATLFQPLKPVPVKMLVTILSLILKLILVKMSMERTEERNQEWSELKFSDLCGKVCIKSYLALILC